MTKEITSSERLGRVHTLCPQLVALLGTMSGDGHEFFESIEPMERHNLLWLALDLAKQIDDLTFNIVPAK